MRRLRHRTVSRPRAILCGAAALFAAAQVALGVFLTHICPQVRDPEYGSLYNALQARLAEWPGRPLVLILGSSRSANIFRPVPPRGGTGAGPDPLLFNFATLYTGPVRQLQMFHRLLARGVRPRWVVAELWTPFLTQRMGFAEEPCIRDRDLQPADRVLVRGYFADPWPAYHKLVEGVLAPAFSHRSQLLAAYSPFLERPLPRPFGDWSDPALRAGEGFGWLPAPEPRPSPEVWRATVTRYAASVREVLADFRISPVADAALRELLQTCARHGVHPAFVLLPEHSSVRACYLPAIQAQVGAYLNDLTRQFGVPVIDTRDWVADDDFLDSRHVLPHVAAPYTERFGRDILRPLLEGWPLPGHLPPGPQLSPAPPGPVGRASPPATLPAVE
jgi:hypothetical protein